MLRIDDTDAARSEARHEDAHPRGPALARAGMGRGARRRRSLRAVPPERAPASGTGRRPRSCWRRGRAYHCFCPRGAPRGAAPRGARRRPHAALRPPLPRAAGRRGAAPAGRRGAGGACASACRRARSSSTTSSAAPSCSAPTRSATSSSCARTAWPATTSPPWSTTATWASRTSSAATTTSPTPRASCCSSRRSAGPPRYAHHSMVLGPDGGKLSKRHGATAVGEYRELGYLPEAIVNYLALLGWSHGEDEVLDIDRLVAEFELERLSPSPAVFDLRQARLARPRAHHGARAAGARAPLRRAAAGRHAAAGGGGARGRLPAVARALRRGAGRWRRRCSRRRRCRRSSRAAALAAAPAAGARPRAARRGGGVAVARRRPRPARRLPRLGQGARHRRPRPAHAAAHRAHRRRARPGAAVRARRAATATTALARLDRTLAGSPAGESTPNDQGDQP